MKARRRKRYFFPTRRRNIVERGERELSNRHDPWAWPSLEALTAGIRLGEYDALDVAQTRELLTRFHGTWPEIKKLSEQAKAAAMQFGVPIGFTVGFTVVDELVQTLKKDD